MQSFCLQGTYSSLFLLSVGRGYRRQDKSGKAISDKKEQEKGRKQKQGMMLLTKWDTELINIECMAKKEKGSHEGKIKWLPFFQGKNADKRYKVQEEKVEAC